MEYAADGHELDNRQHLFPSRRRTTPRRPPPNNKVNRQTLTEPTDSKQFSAERLAKWRDLRGLSLTTIGKSVGRTRQTVRNWEDGLSQPRANEMAALAELLHCEIDELYEAA